MNTTIKDIAKKTGVSYATVSRALNDKNGVNARTRKKILECASRMNYSPNAIARGLVSRRTNSIGLIIPDISNPFFPEVARGVEDAAQAAGYSVILCNTNWELLRENHYIKLLVEKRVDGIIIAPVAKQAAGIEKLMRGLPCMFVSRSPARSGASSVTIDNVKGGFLATSHLLSTGRSPVGFFGAPADSQTLAERFKGYKLALEAGGEKYDERYVCFGDFKRETGYELIKKLIRAGRVPRGIFGENDLLAIGAIQGAREMGLRIPEDVAVVGFDDISLAGFPEIQLTTIAQPKYEMGRLAFDQLLASLREPGGKDCGRQRMVLEPRLILRNSA